MKAIAKGVEPTSLTNYRAACPDSTWEEMKNDPQHGGQSAYREIKRRLVRNQRCLCVFCEQSIATGMSDAEIDLARQDQAVEHFHPKSDSSRPPNWALCWETMWAVCLGGSVKPRDGDPHDPDRYMPPLPENLSCDKFKDHQIDAGKLPLSPEGWIACPEEIPASPILFQFASDASIEPHPVNAESFVFATNHRAGTNELLSETIQHLNLNCNRLRRRRIIVKNVLEKRIRQTRQQHPGASPRDVLLLLARRLFTNKPNLPWPEFFTLLRWRLDEAAETRLSELDYQG